MDKESARQQAQQIAVELATRIDQAMLSIVVRKPNGNFGLHGTGTLFRLGDVSFLVTAAHVIEQAVDAGLPLCVPADSGAFIQPGGDVRVSKIDRGVARILDAPTDLDCAIWEFLPEDLEHFKRKTFLRSSEISTAADVRTGDFFVCGYPVCWERYSDDRQSLVARPWYYFTTPFQDPTRFSGYDARIHVLLNLSPLESVHADGKSATMPDHLRGISGGCICKFHIKNNGEGMVNVVGIQTSVRREGDARVIQGTRWEAVARMMERAHPELAQPLREIILPRLR